MPPSPQPGRACGRALIPAKTLADLTKDLTDGTVTLALSEDTGMIGLTASGRTGTTRALGVLSRDVGDTRAGCLNR